MTKDYKTLWVKDHVDKFLHHCKRRRELYDARIAAHYNEMGVDHDAEMDDDDLGGREPIEIGARNPVERAMLDFLLPQQSYVEQADMEEAVVAACGESDDTRVRVNHTMKWWRKKGWIIFGKQVMSDSGRLVHKVALARKDDDEY